MNGGENGEAEKKGEVVNLSVEKIKRAADSPQQVDAGDFQRFVNDTAAKLEEQLGANAEFEASMHADVAERMETKDRVAILKDAEARGLSVYGAGYLLAVAREYMKRKQEKQDGSPK